MQALEESLKQKWPDVYQSVSSPEGRVDGLKMRQWTMTQKLPSCNLPRMIAQCIQYLNETIGNETHGNEIETEVVEVPSEVPSEVPLEVPSQVSFATSRVSLVETNQFIQNLFQNEELYQDLLLSLQIVHGVFRDASEEDLEHSNLLAEQDAA